MASEYRRVLVAIDIYATYKPILERAIQIAGGTQHLHVVYVTMPQTSCEPYGFYLERDFTSEICDQAEQKLKEITASYAIPEGQVHVEIGSAADMIHNVANEIEAELIVIGTHGRSGVKLLLGATASSVLHGVKRDVLAVRIDQ